MTCCVRRISRWDRRKKRLPFADARAGMAGAETLLSIGLGLVREGVIDRQRLFALLASNPAQVLGVEAGTLGIGQPADLVLIDPDAPWQIDGDRFRASAGNTPFDKLPVQGHPRRLFKGGRELPLPA